MNTIKGSTVMHHREIAKSLSCGGFLCHYLGMLRHYPHLILVTDSVAPPTKCFAFFD